MQICRANRQPANKEHTSAKCCTNFYCITLHCAHVQINGSITIHLPFRSKTVSVVRCKHLVSSGHIQLELVLAGMNADNELQTQVFRKAALSVRKLRAAVLRRIGIKAIMW